MIQRPAFELELPTVTGIDLGANGRAAPARVRTPLLVILPGTTAGYAAMEFMRHARDLSGADRRRIALVYIDIDEPHAQLNSFRREHPGLFNEKIVRIGVPRRVANIARIEQDEQRGEPHTYLDGKVPDAFQSGAAGIRNNGHVAFCHDASAIADNLNDAIAEITSREAYGDLDLPRGVRVSIVSFIGGGTASGIVADLACLSRQLLDGHGLDPHITLTCILPSNLRGDGSDLRRSNAVACLLEVLALSAASELNGGRYRKYLRAEAHDLPPGPIAAETYLIGSAGMTDSRQIARIAGMDLFQKALDGSGVGALERSEAVNRVTLGWQDDRGLPTMFGTSCPVEARFPAQETALAFARMAASHALPLLIGYELPPEVAAGDERERWAQEWRRVAPIDAGPESVKVPDIDRGLYLDLDETAIEALHRDEFEAAAATITRQMEALVARERARQLARLAEEGGSPPERMRRWQRRLREYETALADLEQRQPPVLLRRPTDLEHRAMRWFRRSRAERRLYEEHREQLRNHAGNERRRLLETLLRDLVERVRNHLAPLSDLASRVDAAHLVAGLRQDAEGSPAWRGHLDEGHPFQLHVLDLDALGRSDGANPAVERLYTWATAAIGGADGAGGLDYGRFLSDIASTADIERLPQSGRQLRETVTGFFQPRYLALLRSANLLQLLAHAAPEPGGQQLVDRALGELGGRLKTLMTRLVPFDERVGGSGCTRALRNETFLSCHVRDDGEEARIKEVATRAGILSTGVDHFRPSLDQHRLQASFMHHAISLSTIDDFFSPTDSAMQQYIRYEQEWYARPTAGGLAPHSCTALRKLVQDTAVVDRLLREAQDQAGDGGRSSPML